MQPFMIAITGGTGSGKSTLADALCARLADRGCALVTEDHYYLPRAEHSPPVTGWSNEDVERVINFDDPATKDMGMFRDHLERLRGGEPISQPYYDFGTHERLSGRHIEVRPQPFIIVEGVHVLSDASFAELFDLKVYVDAPVDIRLIRRIRRDRDERERDLERTLGQYLNFVRTAHLAHTEPAKVICDLVVGETGSFSNDANGPDAAAIERLVAPVWRRLQELGVIA